MKLNHVTSIGFDDIKGIQMDKKNPAMTTHLRILKCFLVYNKRKCRERDTLLSEDDVMNIAEAEFNLYVGSAVIVTTTAGNVGMGTTAPQAKLSNAFIYSWLISVFSQGSST